MNKFGDALGALAGEFARATMSARELIAAARASAFQRLADLRGQASAELEQAIVRAHGAPTSGEDDPNRPLFPPHYGSTRDWSDPAWDFLTPVSSFDSVPRLSRIGVLCDELNVPGSAEPLSLRVPALLPVIGTGNVLIQADGAALDQACVAVQSLLLRSIAGIIPGKLRLTLVDNTGLGGGFSELLGFHEFIRGDMVWHEPEHIERALEELVAHMSVVIQKYLTNEFPDIESYNASVKEVKEAYRFLVISRFPAGFDRDMADRVASIAKNGPRVGVYVIMTRNIAAPLPHGFAMTEIERSSTILAAERDGRFLWKHPGLAAPRVELDGVPEKSRVAFLMKQVNEPAVESQTVVVGFQQFAPRIPWQEKTDDGLDVPIGREGVRNQRFQVGQNKGTVHHGLIVGRTGSGKSKLLHALITNLSLHYSPRELQFYLVDFKEGVEFEVYRNLPHARVVAIESEREFGLSVLEGLQRELNRRGDLFRNVGVNTLKAYREKTGDIQPRILLIVDEFQAFFSFNDRLATQANALLDDIARRGRSFGIHELLVSQTISSGPQLSVEASTLAQMGLRIAFQLGEADSYRVFSRENDAARHLERPGEAIYNALGGQVGGNNKFQAAFLPDSECSQYVRDLAERAKQEGIEVSPVVFEGNRPARIERNRELAVLMESTPTIARPKAVRLFLGEPTSLLEGHAYFTMRDQSRSNLLCLGQEEEGALCTFFSALLAWSAQLPKDSGQLFVLNLTNVDDAFHEDLEVCRMFPQGVQIGKRREVTGFIEKVAGLLHERIAAAGVDASPGNRTPVMLGVFGLQRARELHREGVMAPPAGRLLGRILRDGPEFGIHTILWADTHANLLRVLESKDVGECDGRVALAGGDSGKILGEHSGSVRVRRNYGVLYQTESTDQLLKFRCYDPSLFSWAREKLSKGRT